MAGGLAHAARTTTSLPGVISKEVGDPAATPAAVAARWHSGDVLFEGASGPVALLEGARALSSAEVAVWQYDGEGPPRRWVYDVRAPRGELRAAVGVSSEERGEGWWQPPRGPSSSLASQAARRGLSECHDATATKVWAPLLAALAGALLLWSAGMTWTVWRMRGQWRARCPKPDECGLSRWIPRPHISRRWRRSR